MSKQQPQYLTINWRKVWRVLHDFEYGRLTIHMAKARLELAGLETPAVEARLRQILKDGHYLMSR